jgi:hypothetical protein
LFREVSIFHEVAFFTAVGLILRRSPFGSGPMADGSTGLSEDISESRVLNVEVDLEVRCARLANLFSNNEILASSCRIMKVAKAMNVSISIVVDSNTPSTGLLSRAIRNLIASCLRSFQYCVNGRNDLHVRVGIRLIRIAVTVENLRFAINLGAGSRTPRPVATDCENSVITVARLIIRVCNARKLDETDSGSRLIITRTNNSFFCHRKNQSKVCEICTRGLFLTR